jgi:hypothetical protein
VTVAYDNFYNVLKFRNTIALFPLDLDYDPFSYLEADR